MMEILIFFIYIVPMQRFMLGFQIEVIILMKVCTGRNLNSIQRLFGMKLWKKIQYQFLQD